MWKKFDFSDKGIISTKKQWERIAKQEAKKTKKSIKQVVEKFKKARRNRLASELLNVSSFGFNDFCNEETLAKWAKEQKMDLNVKQK